MSDTQIDLCTALADQIGILVDFDSYRLLQSFCKTDPNRAEKILRHLTSLSKIEVEEGDRYGMKAGQRVSYNQQILAHITFMVGVDQGYFD